MRGHLLLQYVYILMFGSMNSSEEIQRVLAAGADDYLIQPYNPVQFRSRVLVGIRWLNYIDSLIVHVRRGEKVTALGPTSLVVQAN